MLKAKLTPCANLLYHWILWRNPSGGKLKVDLQDFQAWTGEYREKAYSDREIFNALKQLKELQLLAVAKTEVTLDVKPPENGKCGARSPVEMLVEEWDCPKYGFVSPTPTPANRFVELVKIVSGSFVLSLTSVALGLALVQAQTQILTNPHPWSVLGDKTISLSP